MKVVFRAAAEAELLETFEYYEAIDASLSDDFIARVDDALERAVAFPFAHAVIIRDLRRVRLQRFPHLLVFRVVDEELVVVACTHPRHDPRRWQQRT